jgi:tRNA (cmo5U34)-methyltransferase
MVANVRAGELNYDHYSMERYDRDIRMAIPGHREVHKRIGKRVKKEFEGKKVKVLELGIGTGLTAETILQQLPDSDYTGIDYSETMLKNAKRKLAKYNPKLVLKDYSINRLPGNNDLVVSVISIHHQRSDKDKKELFKKVFDSLSEKGIFIWADLVTSRDREEFALNEYLHCHHLVEKAPSRKALREWAFHHKFMNSCAPLEDQIDWLRQAGFKETVAFRKFTTALVFCRKA